MDSNETIEVLDRLSQLTVKEDKVEGEFEKDFGSRLRLAKGALLIRDIGNRLHCSLITVAKAMVLFHKLKENPRLNSSHLTSVACLNLSIKLCEEDVSPHDIILESYHVILDFEKKPNPTRPDPSRREMQIMKQSLLFAEYWICQAFAYKLDCQIAHSYVYRFLAHLQSLTDISDTIMVSVSTTVTKLLCTYYMCEGCKDYTATEIAFATYQFVYLYCASVCSSVVKDLLRKEIAGAPDKNKTAQILDELIVVADVSTTLKYI